jgi:hypothetical protein
MSSRDDGKKLLLEWLTLVLVVVSLGIYTYFQGIYLLASGFEFFRLVFGIAAGG